MKKVICSSKELACFGIYSVFYDRYSDKYQVVTSDSLKVVEEFDSYEEATSFCRDRYRYTEDMRYDDLYKSFERYCKKMPGKFYPTIDGEKKLGCFFENPLRRFAESFEKKYSMVDIDIRKSYYGGEYFWYVNCVVAMEIS